MCNYWYAQLTTGNDIELYRFVTRRDRDYWVAGDPRNRTSLVADIAKRDLVCPEYKIFRTAKKNQLWEPVETMERLVGLVDGTEFKRSEPISNALSADVARQMAEKVRRERMDQCFDEIFAKIRDAANDGQMSIEYEFGIGGDVVQLVLDELQSEGYSVSGKDGAHTIGWAVELAA